MRRRLAECDELCNALITLYRAAQALSSSGLGIDSDSAVRRAPASVHTICSMIRDFVESIGRVFDLVEFDAGADPTAGECPVGPFIRKAMVEAIDEHVSLRSWKDVAWVGVARDPSRQVNFQWGTAMDCLQKDPKRGYPALRPLTLLAKRVADEAYALFDPVTGPIAEERAAAYSITRKLRTQIEHIRSLVNRKCDALEGEMQSVQGAIIKAQSQTMALVKNLANIGKSSS